VWERSFDYYFKTLGAFPGEPRGIVSSPFEGPFERVRKSWQLLISDSQNEVARLAYFSSGIFLNLLLISK
jgi:hypothetical protein